MLFGPVKDVGGLAKTVIGAVGSDTQPEEAVNVKNAVPGLTAVTFPKLSTVATAELLVAHVPPEVGDTVVVKPVHTCVGPVILTTGLLVMVIVVGRD